MKLLLPIDGSDCSQETLNWALDTFDRQKVIYHLLFVIPVLPDLNTVDFDIVEANALLRKSRDLIESKGGQVESADYALGDVVDQICRAAETLDVDQIVLGSHGRTGLAKWIMGSTSTRVLEQSPRSVIVHRRTMPAMAKGNRSYSQHVF